MAGSTTSSYDNLGLAGAIRDTTVEHNKNTKRTVIIPIEDLAAGADITARGEFSHPEAIVVTDVKYLARGASAGVDGSNTAVLKLRNITASEDVATVTLSADVTLNSLTSLTLTAANTDVAASAVLGIVVTQGATADLGIGSLLVTFATCDKIGVGGTAIT